MTRAWDKENVRIPTGIENMTSINLRELIESKVI